MRVIDLLVVHKEEDGSIDKVEIADEHELTKLGALAGALIGFGAAGEEGAEVGAEAGAELGEEGTVFDDAEVWYLADAIPAGSTAAICLLEHRWAIPLRNAIAEQAAWRWPTSGCTRRTCWRWAPRSAWRSTTEQRTRA